MQRVGHILVVEPERRDAEYLRRHLSLLGVTAATANTPGQTLRLLREWIFYEAIVAAEMDAATEPMLACLSRLPSMRHLLATGPPGDLAMERRARSAGACAYLCRPATTEAIALALGVLGAANPARAP